MEKTFRSQTHNPHSVGCPFQEQEVPHPRSLIHSNHAWRARAWYFRDEKQPGHQIATSVTEKTDTDTFAAYRHETEEAQGVRGGTPRGHFARLAPWWAKAWAESQQETGLSRKQHQEHVRRGSSSDCRKTGARERVWLISGTAELLGEATQHPLYIHLPLPPLRGFDSDLILHRYEQRLKCKPELNRVIRNEKLVDGYLFEMKAETFYNISWKNMILLSRGFKLPLGFKQQNNCLLLWFLFLFFLI